MSGCWQLTTTKKILLVTDHSVLQWARAYKGVNQQLAAWGAVYQVYTPGLEIVHRAGCIHSDVDPLSWLVRLPPSHDSPSRDDLEVLPLDNSGTAQAAEDKNQQQLAKQAHIARLNTLDSLEDNAVSTWAVMRLAGWKKAPVEAEEEPMAQPMGKDHPEEAAKQIPENKAKHSEQVLYTMTQDWLDEFKTGYNANPFFNSLLNGNKLKMDLSSAAMRFIQSPDGLIWFCDAAQLLHLGVPYGQL
ncbi:hypothetical protein FRB95_001420 [Tulasnella sp. JGI-2019a]|nr:hypothetical protein FRB95_001420 [Tulasnella sp. JGI-2019a]